MMWGYFDPHSLFKTYFPKTHPYILSTYLKFPVEIFKIFSHQNSVLLERITIPSYDLILLKHPRLEYPNSSWWVG
jgi:hypothetical protein